MDDTIDDILDRCINLKNMLEHQEITIYDVILEIENIMSELEYIKDN